MLKSVFLALLVLGIAVGGGAASVWYALNAQEGVGAVTVGGWTSFPDIGTPEADPYSKARIARQGVLALGRAEGLAFTAQRDGNGDPLLRQCSYRIEGTVPTARFWTLHAADSNGDPIGTDGIRAVALDSYEAIRHPDSSITITADRHPAPGNWLALSGSGPMSFVLILYDTTIATSTEIAGVELPQILKVDCNA
jgi:hypothetical protein